MSRGDRFRGDGYVVVGNALYRTVGDRADAARSLALAWDSTFADIAQQVFPGHPSNQIGTRAGELARPGGNPLWIPFWFDTFKPASDAWVTFRLKVLGGDQTVADSYLAYADRWASNWSEYTAWFDKLAALRNTARLLGMHLNSPDPQPLATTIAEDVTNAGQKVASHLGDLSKVAVYGAIGVAALGVAIYASKGK